MPRRDARSRDDGSTPPATNAPDAKAPLSRRDLLTGAAGAIGGAVLAGLPGAASGQGLAAPPPLPAAATQDGASLPVVPADPTKVPGTPTSARGARSAFVTSSRTPTGDITGSSLTPLQDLTGTITPADLHFERHHAGVPAIDPERHELLVHGMVERPLAFTLAELKRFPQVTRTYFVECAGNGRAAWRDPKPDRTPQQVDGMTSNSEWTGIPLGTLLREAGVGREASWVLAEGADACVMTRSVPIAKAWDDALVAWAQNGEPLRPAQGFPLRLVLPGWEGNINVKWLRRLEVGSAPWMTRWETSKYTDPLPGDKARIFSFEHDAKSIITSPAYPSVIAPGWWPVTGIAWSGRGRIVRVDVSTDGGRSWEPSRLQEPTLPKAHTRFQHMWRWGGEPAVLMSRAVDETGYVQPMRSELLAVRGPGTDYHFNPVRAWRVEANGLVLFQGET
jgi:sulfane dehydrogenase subunit SoxC